MTCPKSPEKCFCYCGLDPQSLIIQAIPAFAGMTKNNTNLYKFNNALFFNALPLQILTNIWLIKNNIIPLLFIKQNC